MNKMLLFVLVLNGLIPATFCAIANPQLSDAVLQGMGNIALNQPGTAIAYFTDSKL